MTLFMAMKWRLRRSFHLARHSSAIHILCIFAYLRSSEQNRIAHNLEFLSEKRQQEQQQRRRCCCGREGVVVDVFSCFIASFSLTQGAHRLPPCYPFSSHLRGQEMAAQRDAFPTDWDTCGIVTLFIFLFSSSRVCPLVNIFPRWRKSPRPSSAHLSPLFSPPDGWRECHTKKEPNDPTRFISFRLLDDGFKTASISSFSS